jgi:hypothetical protein
MNAGIAMKEKKLHKTRTKDATESVPHCQAARTKNTTPIIADTVAFNGLTLSLATANSRITYQNIQYLSFSKTLSTQNYLNIRDSLHSVGSLK